MNHPYLKDEIAKNSDVLKYKEHCIEVHRLH